MWYRKTLIAAFFIILLAVPAAIFLLPRQDTGAEMPVFSLSALLDGSYMEQTEDFFSERMILQDFQEKARAQLALLEGKREINGVFIGENRLMEKLAEPSRDYTGQCLEALDTFAERHRMQEVVLMLVPSASEFYPGDLPAFAQTFDQSQYIQDFYRELPRITCVDAYTPLAAGTGGPVFYRTDHHWTSYGAYLGYTALAKSLGYRAASWDLFNIEHAAHDFQGDLSLRTRLDTKWQDTIDLYTYAYSGVVEDVIRDNGKNTVTYPTIFFREALNWEDKCNVFLGYEPGVFHIRTNVGNGKRLLAFTDSLGDPLMQFLPLHYEEITLVDLWSFEGDLEDYLRIYRYQQVLFLLDMSSLSAGLPLTEVANY